MEEILFPIIFRSLLEEIFGWTKASRKNITEHITYLLNEHSEFPPDRIRVEAMRERWRPGELYETSRTPSNDLHRGI